MFNQWFCAVVYFFFLSRPIFASDTESSSITSGLSDQWPLDIIVASRVLGSTGFRYSCRLCDHGHRLLFMSFGP